MTWPTWEKRRGEISAELARHSSKVRNLPGIADTLSRDTLATQIIASLRRESYYELVQRAPIPPRRADPNSPSFDAERAVTFHLQQGNVEEASWLIFLMTLFGRPASSGWLRLKDVYGALGEGLWTWERVSSDPTQFAQWLDANWQRVRGKFGNHRKYESLRPTSARSTSRVVRDYVAWIGPKGHRAFFADAVRSAGNDPHIIFEHIYNSFDVVTFGRLGRFDYLALIGRFGIAPLDAGSAYLDGATGPAAGAHLLFDGRSDGSSSNKQLQKFLDELDRSLNVGMRVLEDALCNWQKSPTKFIHFVG